MEQFRNTTKKIKTVTAKIKEETTAAQYYMDVRNNKVKLSYLHPDLASCTTNGVFVYQEEVMKFLVEIAGYTWEESDMIRSAIAKKKHEVIMACFDRIRASTAKRGWTKEQSDAVCEQIQAFARYSFNLSHSYAYGELGYITMYLKHHFPLEWWSSVLNNEDKEEKIRKFITLLGPMIKPPSVKNPSKIFQIVGDHIITPLSAIKSVGDSSVSEIVSKGPFDSIEDFVSKINHTKANTGIVSQLIKARAFDCLMDESEANYAERRRKFMDKYVSLRGKKVSLKEELKQLDAMSIFLMEKNSNTCFNKTLLDEPEIMDMLVKKWPGLSKTNKQGIPLLMGNNTHVLSSIKLAEGLQLKGHDGDIAMFLLFQSSDFTRGISKKSGRPWSKHSVMLSDGYNLIEAVEWSPKSPKALRVPEDTIVYVRGTLVEGWETPACINIKEIVTV